MRSIRGEWPIKCKEDHSNPSEVAAPVPMALVYFFSVDFGGDHELVGFGLLLGPAPGVNRFGYKDSMLLATPFGSVWLRPIGGVVISTVCVTIHGCLRTSEAEIRFSGSAVSSFCIRSFALWETLGVSGNFSGSSFPRALSNLERPVSRNGSSPYKSSNKTVPSDQRSVEAS